MSLSFCWEATRSPLWLIESWGYTQVGDEEDPSPSFPADPLASLHTAVIPVYAPPCQTNPASRGSLCGDNRSRKQTNNVEAVSNFEAKAAGWLGFLIS